MIVELKCKGGNEKREKRNGKRESGTGAGRLKASCREKRRK